MQLGFWILLNLINFLFYYTIKNAKIILLSIKYLKIKFIKNLILNNKIDQKNIKKWQKNLNMTFWLIFSQPTKPETKVMDSTWSI